MFMLGFVKRICYKLNLFISHIFYRILDSLVLFGHFVVPAWDT